MSAPLEDLEKQRLQSEIQRTDAERQKLLLEAEEVAKRTARAWYSGRFVVEATVAGVVASALIAAWVINYLQPILAAKQELTALEQQIEASTNKLVAEENKRKAEVLTKENDRVRSEMIVLSEKNRSLQQQQVRAAQRAEDLRKRLQEQSEIVQASIDEKSPDSQELSRLTSLANTYKAEVEQLTQEIQKITMDRGSLVIF